MSRSTKVPVPTIVIFAWSRLITPNSKRVSPPRKSPMANSTAMSPGSMSSWLCPSTSLMNTWLIGARTRPISIAMRPANTAKRTPEALWRSRDQSAGVARYSWPPGVNSAALVK